MIVVYGVCSDVRFTKFVAQINSPLNRLRGWQCDHGIDIPWGLCAGLFDGNGNCKYRVCWARDSDDGIAGFARRKARVGFVGVFGATLFDLY
jgi:hypothetical protein